MKHTKLWISQATRILRETLQPLPTEVNELDWKSDLSPNKERLVEHLSAFANHPGGGFLVFGIADSPFRLKGVTAEEAHEIVTKLANLGRHAVEPPIIIDHAVVEWEGVSLLFVNIPEPAVRPVHLRGKSVENAWIRSGGSTRKASRQEIGGLLMNSNAPRWETMRASKLLTTDAAVDALHVSTIADLLNRPLPKDKDELIGWMCEENMIELDRGGAYITNFGAMSAAKDLTQFDSLARKRLRVIRYRGLNKVSTIDEQIENQGYAVSFDGLIKQLKLVLPHSEVIRAALRSDTFLYPELALRELIANALIHQDFSLSGTGPMLEIFDNRIEFVSPGRLLPGKTPDRLIGTTPLSRNELLASHFRRYRLCEERGTGFEKVVTQAELYGLPPLQFIPTENAFKVVLFAPRQFLQMSRSERIEACYQHAVLRHLSTSSMTNTSLRERLKMSERQRNQVTNLISDAVNSGRIKRKDPESANKFAEYIPYWA